MIVQLIGLLCYCCATPDIVLQPTQYSQMTTRLKLQLQPLDVLRSEINPEIRAMKKMTKKMTKKKESEPNVDNFNTFHHKEKR